MRCAADGRCVCGAAAAVLAATQLQRGPRCALRRQAARACARSRVRTLCTHRHRCPARLIPPPPSPLPLCCLDLEWKVIYVGSASGPQHDQELECVLVGPVPLGTSKFMLTAPRPDASAIPEEDILGATVVLVTCAYRNHEFIRVVRDGERGVARRAKFPASPTLPPPPLPLPSRPPATPSSRRATG